MNDRFDVSKIKWENDDDFEDKGQSAGDLPKEAGFAEMFSQSDDALTNGPLVRVGELTKGTITSIGTEGDVLVDLGIKNVGIISKDELMDSDGSLKYKQGDLLEALVISRKGNEIHLSLSLSAKLRSQNDLQAAYDNKIPVRGKVTGVNKGGFEVSLVGLKAFCPISQMDTRFVEDKSQYVGQDFEFLIEKMSGLRNVVVSRAAALRVQQEARIEQIKEELDSDEEKIYEGKVIDIKDFGAFVEFEGIEGMVYRTEVAWGRVDDVRSFLELGQKVRIKVLKIENSTHGQKVSLSMKGALQDPWDHILDSYKISKEYKAKVVKLEKFGAFVELEQGLEGLIHISEMSWIKRIHHPSDLLSVGDQVDVRILSVDVEKKRMQLSLKSIEENPWLNIEQKFPLGSVVKGTVESLKNFGVIIEIAPGLSGLLPVSTLKRVHGNTYRKSFQNGSEVEVKVSAIDLGEKRILLSIADAGGEDEDSYKNYEAYIQEENKVVENQKPKEQLGALALALQQKLNK